jgi:hypothetical protein
MNVKSAVFSAPYPMGFVSPSKGFVSPSNFSWTFRRSVDMTRRQYRTHRPIYLHHRYRASSLNGDAEALKVLVPATDGVSATPLSARFGAN